MSQLRCTLRCTALRLGAVTCCTGPSVPHATLRGVIALPMPQTVPPSGWRSEAGEPGFEPGFTVLETVRIAVNSLPRGAVHASWGQDPVAGLARSL